MFKPNLGSSQPMITGKGGTRISKWVPICVPTHVRGFDRLIHGGADDKNEETGGLPLSSPGVTTFAGGPGTGKSLFTYNMIAMHLRYGNPILFFTLEKPISEVGWNILNIAHALGIDVPCEDENDYYTIKNFECIDYYSSGVGKGTATEMARRIIDWQRRTKGKIVVVDSITELTAYEMHLRQVLKRFITTVSSSFVKQKIQVAILITSQHRGAYRDAGIAGGMAIGHRSNAVIQLDATFADNFDKRYFNVPRGTQVRRIWVKKTASFGHDVAEHFLNISEQGIVTVSELPINAFSELKCSTCGNPVDPNYDHVIHYSGKKRLIAHKSCFLEGNISPKNSRGLRKIL